MSKMHYFSNKFSKISKRWRLSAEIELQNIDDVISVTSSPLFHRETYQNNVTKNFPIWAPPNQNFWLRQWSWVNNLTQSKFLATPVVLG